MSNHVTSSHDDSAPVDDPGQSMYRLVERMFPICRSITGNGVRESLRQLQSLIPLEVVEVPSGTRVFDWEVPQEWNIEDAWISDASGRRVVDFRESNLHVVNGSASLRTRLKWRDLRQKLHTLEQQPDLIPYRTCFHAQDWGFCLSHRQFLELDQRGAEEEYEVVVDSHIVDGSLTYGEFLLPGETEDEVLVSAHICHPSLANDGLSGVAVASHLAQHLSERPRRYSYRFVFAPATIGAITWLTVNKDILTRIRHGFLLPVVGDQGPFHWRRSRQGNSEIDRAACHVLQHCGPHEIRDFVPFGYDQRQYCSPGINLPVGCLMRTPNGEYDEYHTSADNLDLISPETLAESLAVCRAIVEVLEHNRVFINTHPLCEPRLGPRGLYHAFGTAADREQCQQAVLWVLNLSDGDHSLLDIAERSGMRFEVIRTAAEKLTEVGLLESESVLAAEAASSPVASDSRFPTPRLSRTGPNEQRSP